MKTFFSPRAMSAARMEYPLVVDTDGRVREYDSGEAQAYFLLSACERTSNEFYQAHHRIDVVERRSRRRNFGAADIYAPGRSMHRRPREHVLLITTKRILFGTTKPPHVRPLAAAALPPSPSPSTLSHPSLTPLSPLSHPPLTTNPPRPSGRCASLSLSSASRALSCRRRTTSSSCGRGTDSSSCPPTYLVTLARTRRQTRSTSARSTARTRRSSRRPSSTSRRSPRCVLPPHQVAWPRGIPSTRNSFGDTWQLPLATRLTGARPVPRRRHRDLPA